jgi:hypothetical protein
MIRCIKFRPYQKNTLQGFCDFELSRVGLNQTRQSDRSARSRGGAKGSVMTAPAMTKSDFSKSNRTPSRDRSAHALCRDAHMKGNSDGKRTGVF